MNTKFKYYDKTHLDIYDAYQQRLIHRDYIAHCHRWSFIVNYLEKRDRKYKNDERYKHARILDVGCGKQVPLYRTLCANRLSGVQSYTGVDINNLNYAHERFVNSKRKTKPLLLGETDILDVDETDANLITCFEMLEHVPQDVSAKVIKHLFDISPEDAVFIASTPCFNGKKAKNHPQELTRDEMKQMLLDAGWVITENFGTFASRNDLYKHLNVEQKMVYDGLKRYYDADVMSTIFAPLYPQHSRNNLWVCSKGDNQ